jgi:hypothetical protein
MIIVTETSTLIPWLEANRADQDSTIPYVRPKEVEGGYELPEDKLIEQGLKALEIDYTLVAVVGGWSFSIPSSEIVEGEILNEY